MYLDGAAAVTGAERQNGRRGHEGGRFFALDPAGNIDSFPDQVVMQPEWSSLANETISAIVQRAGDRLDGIYLRGAVAEGRARPFTSVLVVIVVTRSNGLPTLAHEVAELEARFPFVKEIAVEVYSLEAIRSELRLRYVQVMLRAQSRHVWGVDRRLEFPSVKPGKEMVFSAHSLETRYGAICDLWASGRSSPRVLRLRSQSFFRAALRSGFELYEEELGLYTRDIDLCADILAEKAPEQAALFYAVEVASLREPELGDAELARSFMEWFLPMRSKRIPVEGEL